jgi:hypothetical protein
MAKLKRTTPKAKTKATTKTKTTKAKAKTTTKATAKPVARARTSATKPAAKKPVAKPKATPAPTTSAGRARAKPAARSANRAVTPSTERMRAVSRGRASTVADRPVAIRTSRPATEPELDAADVDAVSMPNQAPTPGSATGASTLVGTVATWRDALNAAVPSTGVDFATVLRALSSESPWSHADTPELVGLERWGRELAQRDRIAGIAALVVAAQHGFPIAAEAGGSLIADVGFRGSEEDPILDGASVEVQIARARAWLDMPGPISEQKVDEAFDHTRQLNVWDDELRPADDSSFYWYLDLGQCCCAAILDVGSNPTGGSYYEWPTPTTVGRGLVIAARGLRSPGKSIAKIVNDLYRAMAS